ncbi:hypothetical protein ACFODZ_13505 [Marinicella sediminis]|uniref:Zinc ribbon domain-containing protein n=1 Tax=Marinicella sediminis TaxID=1792834 RepID=A0ABV7JB95_9GAMM|nr:hypothetical protein [Marinicella sediminis]
MNLITRLINTVFKSNPSYSSYLAARYCRQSRKFHDKSHDELSDQLEELNNCLGQLENQASLLVESATKSQLRNLWMDGQAMALACQALYENLKEKNLPDQTLRAARLWAKTSGCFNGHYLHLSGTALMAFALSSEHSSRNQAEKIYEHLITATEKVFKHIQRQAFRPIEEDLIITENCQKALKGLQRLSPEKFVKYAELNEKVIVVMSKEKDPGWIEGPANVSVQRNGRVRCPRCQFNFIHRSVNQPCPSCGLQVIADK